MTDDINDLPIVPLAGFEMWADAHAAGGMLDARFPGQDAGDLMSCITYNDDFGPLPGHQIDGLVCVEHGDRVGPPWVFVHVSAELWALVGTCDYTGWDCVSACAWTRIEQPS